MNDLISVIIPIYGVEPYLEQCIQSVRNQTYKNLEIILVCQDSGDRCPQICERHAIEDERIKVIRPLKKGLDYARKQGMRAATGKYVGYVDGDDWIEPNMYEELLRYAHEYEVDVVESGVIDSWIDVEKNRTTYLAEGCYKGIDFIEKVEPKLLYSGIFFEHGITPYMCSKLFLKDKIEAYQMEEGEANTMYDDIMVSLPCIAEAKKLYISHKCFYHYRIRSGSLKRVYRKKEVENLKRCYPAFFSKFSGSLLCDKNDSQIKSFAMYWLLYRAPHVFDNFMDGFYLKPFGRIRVKDNIVLYGAGAVGIHFEQYIRNVEGSNLVCWADHNYEKLQGALNVINPREIINYEYDYVIITIMRGRAVESAKKELVSLGVSEEKIRWVEQEYIDNPDLLLKDILDL